MILARPYASSNSWRDVPLSNGDKALDEAATVPLLRSKRAFRSETLVDRALAPAISEEVSLGQGNCRHRPYFTYPVACQHSLHVSTPTRGGRASKVLRRALYGPSSAFSMASLSLRLFPQLLQLQLHRDFGRSRWDGEPSCLSQAGSVEDNMPEATWAFAMSPSMQLEAHAR